MKQKLLFIVLTTIMTLPISGQINLYTEDFETNGNGSRYNVSGEFYDGVDDYFGRVYGSTLEYGNPFTNDLIQLSGTNVIAQNGMYTSFNGDFYMAGEDQDDGGGDGIDEKTLTFSVDISTGDMLSFKGLFAAGNEEGCSSANSYDSTDYIEVYYNVDGSGDVLALSFIADINCGDTVNNPLFNDPNLDGLLDDGILMGNTMQEFSFGFPNGNNVVITVETHLDGGSEEVAYDYFRVEAQNTLGLNEADYLTNVSIYPNPSNGLITLKKPSGIVLKQALVYNVLGNQVKSVNLETMTDSKTIDLSLLSSGLYVLNIQTANGNAITKKIVIK